MEATDPAAVFRRLEETHVEVCRLERRRLRAILECDRHDLWQHQGYKTHAAFLAARYDISQWKARRWIAAAYALEHLPRLSDALASGTLSLEKVVELTRFATPATERELISWARRVTPGGVRERADQEVRISPARTEQAESQRSLTWWWDHERKGLAYEGWMPAANGGEFISAIDRIAKDVPEDPPDEKAAAEVDAIDRRRADALMLLVSASIAEDQDPARARVVVHAPFEAMRSQGNRGNSAIAGGPATDVRVAQRLACDGCIDVVLYHGDAAVGIGRASREPTPWLRRQVLFRQDHACGFPGCGMKRFLHVHHIHWWEWNGPTNLDNLIAVCPFHHKLVHEHGWSVTLQGDVPVWYRPSGRRFEIGPAPPADDEVPQRSEADVSARAPWGQLWHALEGGSDALGDALALRRLLKLGAREPV